MVNASPARLYATLVGGALVVAGIIGFFYSASFGSPGDVDDVFGILAVNAWHNIVHILTGAIGLLAQRIAAADGAKPCAVVAASPAKDRVVAGDPAATVVVPAAVDGLAAEVVVEATGAAAGLDLALRAAGAGGTVVVLGTTRAEAVALPLDLVAGRALRLVGAHAGLLDAPGGTSGLDRRSAAQRFLDRVTTFIAS